MENPDTKKFFIWIFIVFCVWIGAVIVIISCMNIMSALDIARGASLDAMDYIGRGMAGTAGFGFSGAGIFFIIASLTMGVKKPDLVKIFVIIIFVLLLAGTAFMAIGSGFLGSGLAEVIACANDTGNSPELRLHCQGDIGYNSVIVVCMVAMAGISVLGIVGAVKIVTILNGAAPSGGFVSTQPASQPPAAAAGTKGKFCAACGAANAADAKFCKGCGKAC